jgi:hypothetical protein
MTYNPETLSGLMKKGIDLWAYCIDCHHNKSLLIATLPLSASTPVPAVAKRMKCSRCGSRNIHTRPDWQYKSLSEFDANTDRPSAS